MPQPDATEPIASLIEMAGLVMVSGLLLPMTRAVPGQFLRYWVYAWSAIAVALLLELCATQVPPAFRPSFLIGYCLGDYLFGFLVWAGCHEFATGEGFRARHAILFLPFALCAVILPVLLGPAEALAVPHGLLMGGVTLFAFVATFRRGLRTLAPTIGLIAIRLALVGLAALHLYGATVLRVSPAMVPELPNDAREHLALVRVLFIATLAFGMAVLASERMREELEGKNRQLAAATAELSAAARTDALTGLFNRRAFEELAQTRPEQENISGCMAVIDLNDLKILNDRYGHASGDAALQVVARAMRNQFRVTDPLYRTGGDEFIAILLGGSPTDLSERIRCLEAHLRAVRLPGATTPTDVTIAWGVAEFASRADLPAACQQADDLMYADKRARKKADGPLSRPLPALG